MVSYKVGQVAAEFSIYPLESVVPASLIPAFSLSECHLEEVVFGVLALWDTDLVFTPDFPEAA